jgi:hypothetical protein
MYQADTAAVDFDLLVIVMDSSSIDLSLAFVRGPTSPAPKPRSSCTPRSISAIQRAACDALQRLLAKR